MILFRSIVGSTSKLGIESSDLDLRGVYVDSNIFDPIKAVSKFERRSKQSEKDIDDWELRYYFRQIIRGSNSCPVLFSSLYCPIYQSSELGDELIQNRDKLISQNLIKGTLKFCDRKVRTRGNHKRSKYLYYACSDMLHVSAILKNEPLKLPQEVIDLYNDQTEDPEIYRTIRNNFETTKIKKRADLEWITNFCKKAYQSI